MTASEYQPGLREYTGRISPSSPFPGILRAQPFLTPIHLCLLRYTWERGQGSVALAVTQDPTRKQPLG